MTASQRSDVFRVLTITMTTVIGTLSAHADISEDACQQIRQLSARTNFPLFFEMSGTFYSLQSQNLADLSNQLQKDRGKNVRFIYLARNIDDPNADDARPTLFAFKQRLSTNNSWNVVQTWNNIRGRAIQTEFARYQKFHREGDQGSVYRPLLQWFHLRVGSIDQAVDSKHWQRPREYLAYEQTDQGGAELRVFLVQASGLRAAGSCIDIRSYLSPTTRELMLSVRNLRPTESGDYTDPFTVNESLGQ